VFDTHRKRGGSSRRILLLGRDDVAQFGSGVKGFLVVKK